MRRKVVENHMDALARRITLSESLPGLKYISGRLTFMNNTFKDIAVNIVETQKLLGASALAIGRAHSLRMGLACPAQTRDWP